VQPSTQMNRLSELFEYILVPMSVNYDKLDTDESGFSLLLYIYYAFWI